MKLSISTLTSNDLPFSKSRIIFMVLIGLGLLATLLHIYLLAAVLLVTVFVCLVPVGTDFGILLRLVLVVLLATSLNAAIGLLTWAIKVPFTAELLLICYTIAAFVLAVFTKPIRPPKLLPHTEFYAGAAAVVCGVVLLLPLTADRSTTGLVRLVGNGVDNIAHIFLIRSIESHHNYLEGYRPVIDHGLDKTISAYPQGFHLNAALIDEVVKPIPKNATYSIRQTLILYTLVTAVFYSTMFYLFVYLALRLLEGARKNVSIDITSAFLALLVASVLFLDVLLGMYVDGFQPEIYAFALFLGLVLFLFELVAAPRKQKARYLLGALLLCAGISFSYFYLLPVALGAMLVVGWRELNIRKSRPPLSILASIGVLLMANLAPLVLYLVYFGSHTKLNDEGGTLMFSTFSILGIFLLAAGYLRTRLKVSRQLSVILLLLVLGAIFAAAVFLYQKVTLGGAPKYYYYKATYTVLILAGLTAAVAVGEIVGKISWLWSKLLVCAGLVCMLWPMHNVILSEYLHRNPYAFTPQFASTITQLLTNPADIQQSTKIISIGNNCLNADDERLMRFMVAFSGIGNARQEKIAEDGFWIQDRAAVYKEIKAYQLDQADKKLIIITANPVVKAGIVQATGNSSRYLQFIDPYQGANPPNLGCEQ